MIKTLIKGIELSKAEKLMKKVNDCIIKDVSIVNWTCYIKKSTLGLKLIIRYANYEDWKEEDLVKILKIIPAVTTKHNLSMYRYDCEHRLKIEIDI